MFPVCDKLDRIEMTARIIAKINSVLREELDKAVTVIRNNRELLDKLVDRLMEKALSNRKR